MFLNKFCKLLLDMVGKLAGYMFRSKRKRLPSQFTEEHLAAIVETCTYPVEGGPRRGGDLDEYRNVCTADLPKGYIRERFGLATYTVLKNCHICGEVGDHMSEDCAIKPCDSEFLEGFS